MTQHDAQTFDSWNGHDRTRFLIDHCDVWLVQPHDPRPGKPWAWCMEFPDAFIERTGAVELLKAGIYYAHIKVGNTFGCPDALDRFDHFYAAMIAQGFATKPALVGLSRGGLYAYNWAARNPENVACIYADAPVCDFKSWPGGNGIGTGSPDDWAALLNCYHFKTEDEAMSWKTNPIDNLFPVAAAKIPLLHVVGDLDRVVPVSENTEVLQARYELLGGQIEVIHKPDVDHHPHGLDDPSPIVDFILKHTSVR